MVGTLEEGLMTLRNSRPVTVQLSPWQKGRIGESVRLEIPLGTPVQLRKIGELLCGLGERLKGYSVRGDITDFHVLLALKSDFLDTRYRILETVGKRMSKGKLVERVDD